jgi:hypothetical protein
MAKSRREKTLADYVVIAISPALIMTLVGSLVFFLLELSYRGDFELRVRWILFWFVVGAVLVARIAIQEGRSHASMFGGALVLVVGLGVFRFVDAIQVVIIVWVLLAVIWWCSWKLTWDCTLIDDSEDASGEGLLEAAGLEGGPDHAAASASDAGRAFAGPALGEREEPRSRPHAPGRWVVFFSLAALPIFGFGQLLIPAANIAGRAFGFQLLAVYVASALGLLLTTSFLGLRRYLRQRKLQMPLAMTGTWIGMGTGLAAALLLLALLIPRPQGGEYTLTALVDKIDAKAREASRLAVVKGDRAQGEGRRIGEQDQQANKPGEGPQRQDPQQANEKQPGQEPGDGKRGEGKQGEQENRDAKNQAQAEGKDGKNGPDKRAGEAGQKQEEQAGAKPQRPEEQGQRGGQQQDQRPPNQQRQNQAQAERKQPAAPRNPGADNPGSPGNWLTQLAPLVKWVLYGIMAAALLYMTVRYWSQLAEVLKRLWAELMSLFGVKDKTASADTTEDAIPAVVRLLPFAAYEDPFFSGAARRMPAAQLVRYTFEALEAWSREQVIARPVDQTPLEFAQELGRRVPALAKDVTQTAQLYAQVAYARHSPSKDALEILERMWRRMQVAARS